MKLLKKMKKERGSLTIEASISMVCFSLVMVFLLTLISTCRAQALVQNAIDKAALEISEFMYLYEATGIYYETVDVTGKGQQAVNSATGVLNGVDNIVTGGEEIGTEIEDRTTSAGGILDGLFTLYKGFSGTDVDSLSGGDIANTVVTAVDGKDGTLTKNYQAIYSGVKQVADDPIGFVKALAKYGLGTANSYLFGACLGETVSVKYMGANSQDIDERTYADERLKSLGVKGGVEGLNFRKSSVFSSNAPTDVNLICTYDVEVFGLLGDFTVTFAQSASTRAWLGGDCTKTLAAAYEQNRNDSGQSGAGSGEVVGGNSGGSGEVVGGNSGGSGEVVGGNSGDSGEVIGGNSGGSGEVIGDDSGEVI